MGTEAVWRVLELRIYVEGEMVFGDNMKRSPQDVYIAPASDLKGAAGASGSSRDPTVDVSG